MNTQEAREDKAKVWDALDAGTKPADLAPTEPAKVVVATTDEDKAAAASLTAATKSESVVEDDPYKDLPDNVRHEIVGLKTMLTKANDNLRSTNGRIGGMQSELKQLKDSIAAGRVTVAPSGATPSNEEIRAAQGDPKAMAKLVENYPEFGGAMKDALVEELAPLREQIKSLSTPKTETPAPSVTREDLSLLRSELQVEAHHPNWQERVRTPQFTGWLQEQTDEVKRLAASESPQDAIKLLDLHTESGKPAVTTDRTKRLASAAAMPSGRTPTVRVKPTENMSKAEYWAHLDALEAQKAN